MLFFYYGKFNLPITSNTYFEIRFLSDVHSAVEAPSIRGDACVNVICVLKLNHNQLKKKDTKMTETADKKNGSPDVLELKEMIELWKTKIKLSALWVVVVLSYLYGDLLTFYEQGFIEGVIIGKGAGGIPITQVMLLGIAVFLMIPIVMVFLSLTLKYKVNRWANIILGIIYTIASLITLPMSTYAFYYFLGIVEAVFCVLIVWNAYKWK